MLVEGVNMVKKHTRPTQANPQGGIVEQEAPIHVSNVMIDRSENRKADPCRLQVCGRQKRQKKKVRYAKKSGEILDK